MSADDCTDPSMSDLLRTERRSGDLAIVCLCLALVACVVALWIV
jgi:hypothetical protein